MLGKLWDKFAGKKTYTTLLVFGIKKGLDALGIETVSDEQVSSFVDTMLGVLTVVFLRMGVGEKEQKAE